MGPVVGEDGLARCPWGSGDPVMQAYHDDEWGRPVEGESALAGQVLRDPEHIEVENRIEEEPREKNALDAPVSKQLRDRGARRGRASGRISSGGKTKGHKPYGQPHET